MLKNKTKKAASQSMTTHNTAPQALKVTRAAISIQTIAEQAGVSIATVSRVLNGNTSKVSEATAKRVMAVVDTLGYRPSRVGSALRSGRSRLVALMVPDPANAYHVAIASSVERQLRARGKILLFCNTQENAEVQDELLREMRAQLVSGIIMLGAVESDELSAQLTADEPIIFVNRRIEGLPPGRFVGIDNFKAGQVVAENFNALGYKKVWLMHGPLTSTATAARVDGFISAFDQGGEINSLGVHKLAMSRMERAYAVACEHLTVADRPDAIFCTTDEIAYGVYKRCRELNLSVPGDIRLFGFDGNPLNGYLAPWLSTIRVPYEDYGSAVVAMLDSYWTKSRYPEEDAIIPFETIVT